MVTAVIFPFVMVTEADALPHGVWYELPVNVPVTPACATGVGGVVCLETEGGVTTCVGVGATGFGVVCAPVFDETTVTPCVFICASAFSRDALNALLVMVAPDTPWIFVLPAASACEIRYGSA